MNFNVWQDTYLPDIMNDISQSLLAPTMVVIVFLIVAMLFLVGQVIVEVFTERRHYKQNIAQIINDIHTADYSEVTGIVERSALLRFQKASLIVVSRNMGLPEEALTSLAQTEIGKVVKRYQGRLAWSDTISKIAPLLGLMGTLIPLGPGIVAMGQGDTMQLSQSLLMAFDATVCGLVIACITLVVSKIRSRWYSEYADTLEALMSCLLEKADEARKGGIVLPMNYVGDPIKEYDSLKKEGACRDSSSSSAVEFAVSQGGER